jgi:hypothetical protein
MTVDQVLVLSIAWSALSSGLARLGAPNPNSYRFGIRRDRGGASSLYAVPGKLKFASSFKVGTLDPDKPITEPFSKGTPDELTDFKNKWEGLRELEQFELYAEGYLDLGCAHAWLGYLADAKERWTRGLDRGIPIEYEQTRDKIKHNIAQLPSKPLDPENLLKWLARANIQLPDLAQFSEIAKESNDHFFLVE